MPSANDNELYFHTPGEYLLSARILVGLLCFSEFSLLWITFLHHHAWEMQMILYRLLPISPLLIASILFVLSQTEVTINFKTRTYQTVRRLPWGNKVRRSSLDDFYAVHVTEKGYVSLIGKKPGPREFSPFRRVVPIGNAGLGTSGAGFVGEVARKIGVEVVTKL